MPFIKNNNDKLLSLLSKEILSKKLKRGDFPFSSFLFWDYSIEKIDTELHKNFIIERFISRGLLEDFYYLQQLYSKEEIIEALKKSKVLDPKTVYFCSHFYNIPITELNASLYYS